MKPLHSRSESTTYRRRLRRWVGWVGWVGLAGFIFGRLCVVDAAPAQGRQHAVATGHPLATQAAMETFARGGNAVDAAVAAALTLGVVDGHNSGIGGGCLLTARLADGRWICWDGRELSPLASSRDMFLRAGVADPKLSQTGPLAVGVPGSLMTYERVLRQYGRMRLADLLARAAEVAEAGFSLDAHYGNRLQSVADDLRRGRPGTNPFFRPDGQLLAAGDILRQPDLARTYRSIAQHGINWFYQGPYAVQVGTWMAENGGRLRAADFQLYEVKQRDPVVTTYRGHTIVGFPPPSSGGVHVGQILNILEHFDLKRMGANSVPTIHLIAEAMKLAFADRAYWLGDPDVVPVPRGLAAKNYAKHLAKRISLKHATPVAGAGTPPNPRDLFSRHTTHLSTADAQGNWVAITATLNTSFGAKVVVDRTGVLLNNQMDDFSIQPGVANYFGLVGSEANAVAPRKRPLSSMSPTIVLKGRQPLLSLGAAGGPTIISQTVLAIVHVVDFGMDLETALLQPRFHHQWRPDRLRMEESIGTNVVASLRRLGHQVEVVDAIPGTQAVAWSSDSRDLVAAADPRGQGSAAAK